jgi:hypothetical protein
MPSSRSERKAIERARGIEFVSPSDFNADEKRAMDYRKHVDSGGERIPEKHPEMKAKKGDLSGRIMKKIKDNYSKGIPWKKTLGQE